MQYLYLAPAACTFAPFMLRVVHRLGFLFLCMLVMGCANIVPPGGGARDTEAPKLLSITPADSALNARPRRIEMRFDEYVVLQDAAAQIQISPLLPLPLSATSNAKRVILNIPDTLLQEGTTYRIRFGNAIQDLHEGNPFGNYSYTFSTGSYFDSLRLSGRVILASSGMPDSAALVALHPADVDDTAVLRKKPLYVTRTDGLGNYAFEGLPAKAFRIYAIGDNNNNLILDGGERIGFLDSLVKPSDSGKVAGVLRTFIEGPDTASAARDNRFAGRGAGIESTSAPTSKTTAFSYLVALDTGDLKARTAELSKPIRISFSAPVASLHNDRIFLAYDSAGVTVEVSATASLDTSSRTLASLSAAWRPDAVYTLRLLKAFARDTSGAEAGPSRYRFRTKREEDYGRLAVNIPTRYYGPGFLLQVSNETDTVYKAPVLDSSVRLTRLQPSGYRLHIVEDLNRNGKWDAGDLLQRRQPEVVFPHGNSIPLKAGWDNIVDFAPARTQPSRSFEDRQQSQ